MSFEDFKEAFRQQQAEQERKKLRAERKRGVQSPRPVAVSTPDLPPPSPPEDYTDSVCLLHSLTHKFPTYLEVLVDAEDLERLSKHRWYLARCGKDRGIRAMTYPSRFLHSVVMNAPKGVVVDHIFHKPLDDRKSKLRIATVRENNINRRPRKQKATKYKGIGQHKKTRKWFVHAGPRGGRVFISGFDSEVDAARAYNDLARRLYGSIAYQNPV